jgi:two-component system, OmpR family, sensor histidine kinase KdpD
MADRRPSLVLAAGRPSRLAGVATAIVAITFTTLVLYPLREVAPAVSLGVVYLLSVLLISTFWGALLGIATGIAGALAFNFFHIPPTGRFTIAEGENWVALAVYVAAAIAVSSIAEAARARAAEGEQRRREADLGAELARLLLGAANLDSALGPAAQRIAAAFELPSAAISAEPAESDERRIAIPLHRAGALLVPRDTPPPVVAVLEQRIAPGLETLMVAALDREALLREVVESAALRRSDELKTAILRTVSHDLRSPLTAMVAAGEALGSPALPDEDRRELAAAIASEGARLTRLIEKLLDLSRLEAGTAEPRRDWTSIEEVVRAAIEAVGAGPDQVSLMLDRDLPLIDADAAQLERAFANLLENALRHSDDLPVSVRARVSGGRLLVRVVDRGPGIPLAEQERIFEPFYRAPGARDIGSGLGLAIVKGFIESNGGRVHVESLPEQGTSFVVSLPLPADGEGAKAPEARHPVPKATSA